MSIYRIARQARVSPSAVSLALRDSPKISPATRERIARIARLQGYRPDARLNELMARMRLSSKLRGRACFAVVSLYGEEAPWNRSAHHVRIYRAMAARADELGYRLEPLWMRAPGMTYRRFRAILDARGIEGILCFGSPCVDDEFPPELKPYAIVTQGMSIRTPLHRVTGNFFNDVLRTLDEVRRRGYRRPGLVISRYEDTRSTHAYVGAYLGWCERALGGAGLPVLRLDRVEDEAVQAWLRGCRPDVVLFVHDHDSLRELDSFLRRRRIRVPADLGVAAISQVLDGTGFSGLEENQRLIGRWAVELLVDRIANRDFGFPASPRIEMVESVWVNGASLRR
ncbi:MAG: LacI family DNA-binding transcriptional regulator [Opitutaceae bacterium]|jgi:LacI family transcriptional regulator